MCVHTYVCERAREKEMCVFAYVCVSVCILATENKLQEYK